MLRACVLDQPAIWDRYMPLVEFVYNNRYHASIGMAPYEALYGRKCKYLLCWMLTTQSHQKSYADQRPKPLEFEEGDHAFLKVTPMIGVGRAIKTKKLNPRYIIQLMEDLTLPVTPVRIDDMSIKRLRGKEVSLVKVAWSRAGIEDHTWELESEMRTDYPHLFSGN
ncbi:uncharacterized protein LOC107615655 [Arachis ipaensis]|uniref:uncharacterized protein LOC107615655 n=1 Tax=Arachis ipaensis TaxID=130454 RepID=UPI0007AF0D48|nr:uncharacterized protein LOC107615655 [Arachis ipaensis]XP_025678615.1 uncharacterized protein LOC112778521 [Arachis hypogaea]